MNESVEDPLRYYDHNVGGTVELLKAMAKHGCKNVGALFCCFFVLRSSSFALVPFFFFLVLVLLLLVVLVPGVRYSVGLMNRSVLCV